MELDFDKLGGLLPAVIQDSVTRKVLMLGFMNREAYQKTLDSGLVTFYSRSRRTLWTKGETSGNFLHLVSLRQDCDNDTLLVQACPVGPVCHTGTDTCWGDVNTASSACLPSLQQRLGQLPVDDRGEGTHRLVQNMGEAALQTVIAASHQDKVAAQDRSAELFCELLVMFNALGVNVDDVVALAAKKAEGRSRDNK